jgi:ABC-type transport system involved in multi-copper enzyme maturation permease subunit
MSLVSWPIARMTARDRALRPFTLLCFALIFFLGWVRNTQDAPGAEAFSNVAGIWFSLLVLGVGAGLLSEEVDSGHAQLVLLRPISRAQWVSGRLAGAALVVCAGAVIGWGTNLAAAAVRAAPFEGRARLVALPLALLPALGWLATLTALSAVVRGIGNAVVVVLVKGGWTLCRFFAPFIFQWLGPLLAAIDPYVGPQDLRPLGATAAGAPPQISPIFWDLFWFFAAWAVAIWLFNRRELARRRG